MTCAFLLLFACIWFRSHSLKGTLTTVRLWLRPSLHLCLFSQHGVDPYIYLCLTEQDIYTKVCFWRLVGVQDWCGHLAFMIPLDYI